MGERFIPAVLKTVVPEKVPGVRIPLPPPLSHILSIVYWKTLISAVIPAKFTLIAHRKVARERSLARNARTDITLSPSRDSVVPFHEVSTHRVPWRRVAHAPYLTTESKANSEWL